MARTPFKVEVLTPEGEVFSDEVEMVSTRTTVGSIGVLANHQPLLGLLEPTELRLYKSDSDIETLRAGRGLPPGRPEGVLVLVEEAIAPDDLDSLRPRGEAAQGRGRRREGRRGLRGAPPARCATRSAGKRS